MEGRELCLVNQKWSVAHALECMDNRQMGFGFCMIQCRRKECVDCGSEVRGIPVGLTDSALSCRSRIRSSVRLATAADMGPRSWRPRVSMTPLIASTSTLLLLGSPSAAVQSDGLSTGYVSVQLHDTNAQASSQGSDVLLHVVSKPCTSNGKL